MAEFQLWETKGSRRRFWFDQRGKDNTRDFGLREKGKRGNLFLDKKKKKRVAYLGLEKVAHL